MTSFDISLWEQSLSEKRQRNEALRHSTLSSIDAVLRRLRSRYTWSEIYVFGSVLREGRFGPESDVDFAVLGLPKHDLYRLVGELSDALDRSVDVMVLEETRMAHSIRRKGVRWEAERGLPSL
jgi:predicted nucleotidyltransferase